MLFEEDFGGSKQALLSGGIWLVYQALKQFSIC